MSKNASDSNSQSRADELMTKMEDNDVGEELLDYVEELLELIQKEEEEEDEEEEEEYRFTELEMAAMKEASDEKWDKTIKNIVKKHLDFEKMEMNNQTNIYDINK